MSSASEASGEGNSDCRVRGTRTILGARAPHPARFARPTSPSGRGEARHLHLSPQGPRRGEVDVERSDASGEGYSDDLEGESPSPGALRAADLSLRER